MRFIKYLSLEVVLGAILYQCFLFEVYFHSLPPVVEVSLFALVVWFLYLVDRQVDIIFQPVQDERHEFHVQYRKFYRVIIGLLGVAIACLLPFQRLEVLLAGFVLLFLVMVYGFAWHKGWLRLEKELFTSVLYGLGVGLVIWVREPRSLILLLPLMALAYQNLCYFTLMESPSDFYSARLKKTEWILIGLISGIYATTQEIFIVLPFLVTFGITYVLSRTAFSEAKHFWGDVAFWSPLIYFLHGIFST
ncbi:hypothetical protein [Aquirufa antheringensis]|jgi:hypothetical protein|uniref:Prenyltransferase n=1 Tax=Aquirufa antheringensis TaxID=2516559 RepID=A0A4Q9B8Z9_9BACT|nr:hypothetical protein [Aquirufa antheringensis]MCZ2485572.1 hypothetical protein [Aquirufa antheringensis]MCZ2486723.1 hypothetical protein [Aquirufa antheringensis]MCZ2488496.1 hypothetical protein [Aquirufa antheringensis]TBH71950.1 hypothetical protein EWU20_08975 [Aquirufa antheringensis]